MSNELNENKLDLTEISEEERKARGRRNVALALCLGALVAIFMGVTMFKVGENLSQLEKSL